jgi:aryl-alcohol dehydrogenase-like predicted oxidoreductase
VQIILNVFRRKPLERVLPAAVEAGVGIIARVPLASGLLSGKYDESTTFGEDDHRNYNRSGAAFDVGETFSGVPVRRGREGGPRGRRAHARGRDDRPAGPALARRPAGRHHRHPGRRNAEQARGNAAAAELPPLTAEQQDALRDVYDRSIREHVHDRW